MTTKFLKITISAGALRPLHRYHSRPVFRSVFIGMLFAMASGKSTAYALDVPITDFGAVADGKTINTTCIQKAIDQVYAHGGGKVLIPKGQFVTGTLDLKSNVRLSLQADSELLGSRSLADYPISNPGSGEVVPGQKAPAGQVLTGSELIQALIVADRAVNVGIEGPGTIDGRGQPDAFPVHVADGKKLGQRPMLMRFFRCRDIHLVNVKLKNAASWGVHLVDCDNVHVRDVEISNRANQNNDGLDIDGCRDVFISDSDISSGDDAICLKSSFEKPVENVFVKDCVISSGTAGFKCGTASRAGFRNIIVSDCVMRNVKMGAIKLECVDGGTLENVLIQNIVMDQVEGPLFIRLGDRGAAYQTPEPDGSPVKVGALRNVTISNVHATVTTTNEARSGIMITGIPGHKVSGIRLHNIVIRFPGMGAADESGNSVPEDEKRYPEQFFFGSLPSYGMFIRHTEDVELDQVRFDYTGEEGRPAFVLEDVSGFTLRDSKMHAEGKTVLDVKDSFDVLVSGCKVAGSPESLVEASASEKNKIGLVENRIPKTTKLISYGGRK